MQWPSSATCSDKENSPAKSYTDTVSPGSFLNGELTARAICIWPAFGKGASPQAVGDRRSRAHRFLCLAARGTCHLAAIAIPGPASQRPANGAAAEIAPRLFLPQAAAGCNPLYPKGGFAGGPRASPTGGIRFFIAGALQEAHAAAEKTSAPSVKGRSA